MVQEKKEMGQRNVIEEDIKFVAGLSLPWEKLDKVEDLKKYL